MRFGWIPWEFQKKSYLHRYYSYRCWEVWNFVGIITILKGPFLWSHSNHPTPQTKRLPLTTLPGTNPSPSSGSSKFPLFREDMWSFRSQEGYTIITSSPNWQYVFIYIYIIPRIYHCYSPCRLGGVSYANQETATLHCSPLWCSAPGGPCCSSKNEGKHPAAACDLGRNGSPGKTVQVSGIFRDPQ